MHRNERLICGNSSAGRVAIAALTLFLAGIFSCIAQEQTYPALMQLPEDQRAEGICAGEGDTFYAASLSNARILVGNLKTGTYSTLVAGKGGGGLKFDSRSGFLYVCDGGFGGAVVYNATTGAEVIRYQFGTPRGATGPPGSVVINDCVVTKEAVYFTDSHGTSLYRVALGPNGEPAATFTTVPLPDDFAWPNNSGAFNPFINANGIDVTDDERYLILVHTGRGSVFRIDTASFEAERIAVSGGDGTAAGRGDGILLDGNKLYVVQNRINRIAVMTMSPDFLSASITGYISEPFASNPALLKVPTTIAKFSNGLYVVTGALVPPGPYYVARLSHPDPIFSSIVYRDNGEALLSVQAEPGNKYDVEYSSDLKAWSSLATVVNSMDPYLAARDGTRHWVVDTAAPFAANRFYRAVKNNDASSIVGDHVTTGVGETPESITVAPDGTVYLGMGPKNGIQKITPNGVISDFTPIPAPGTATGVKTDAAGNVYVVKRSNPSNVGVWKVSPQGVASLFASIPDSEFLNDLAFDDRGNIYVTDTRKGAVFKVDQNGKSHLWNEDPLLRGQAPPVAPAVPFPAPWVGANGVAYNPANSTLYVINTVMGGLIQIPANPDGTAGAASLLVQDNSLVGGDGITLDTSGNIYVAVNFQSRIAMVTPEGKVSTLAEGGLLHIGSSLAFGHGADQNALYVCNFAIPSLAGNPAFAGALKFDLTTKTFTPVAYLNQDITLSHPRYSQHATVMMKWAGRTVYADPSSSGKGVDAAVVFKDWPLADLIVITHFHGDHYDTNALKVLSKDDTVIVAPRHVFDLMPDSLKALTTVMANGESVEKVGVGIEAIPSYNLDPKRQFHPKGRDNGYVLSMGGKRIYIPGDTEDIPEMRALKGIDVAFLPMNLPFTMTMESAASAVREFKPKVIYPFHYTGAGMTDAGPDFSKRVTADVAKFKELIGTDLGIEVRFRRWYEPLEMQERIPATDSDIVVQPIHHATVLLTWNGKRIYSDPSGGTEGTLTERTALFQGYPLADLIVVTHFHADHFDTNILNVLVGPSTQIAAPQSVFDRMPEPLKAITTVMQNGQSATLAGIPVEAVPAYNLDPKTLFHPKGRDNGYVVTLGGKRLYIAGDTEDHPEMRALKDIDVAFIPMNLPFTMTAARAADAVRQFKPAIVYPYHYVHATGGIGEDVQKFKRLVGTDLGIEVRLRPFYTTVH